MLIKFAFQYSKYFQERSLKGKIIISDIFPRDECCSVSRIITDEINNILAEKCSLHGFDFIVVIKYARFRENRMLNSNLYLTDNVHLIRQGNAKLTLVFLVAINGSILSPSRRKSIITSYKNAVLFLFKDSDLRHYPSNICKSRQYQYKCW